MVRNICDRPSIASAYLEHLRNVESQANPSNFRSNLRRLGNIFAYEISKTFRYKEIETETPFGMAKCQVPDEEVVLITILRAGLPMHEGLLDFFGQVENGFIAAQRLHHKDGSFEIGVDYINCPDVEGKTIILSDPMIATGSSIVASLQAIRDIGRPDRIHVVSVIGTPSGMDYVKRNFPRAEVWVAGVDDELTAKSYIVPGLGDAGDLAFGIKQEHE